MKWLITGGCGFIGTSLIKNLKEEGGHNIRVIDNLSVGTREDLEKVCNFTENDISDIAELNDFDVQLICGDILDEELAEKSAMGMDIIVHLAANTGVAPSVEDPRKDCFTNVLGTFNYLEAARKKGIKRFVFASSGAPVGETEPPIHEQKPVQPVSPYGASKLAGEGYCSAYFRTFGIETVALRFGNVYGPGSGHKNSVIAKFIKSAINGEVLEVFGDGTQTRDFIYIDDLIRAIRLSASKEGVGGEIFQIATSRETTLNELVGELLPLLSQSSITDVKLQHADKRQGDVLRNYSDTSKAKKKLGWANRTELQQGLNETIRWYMKKYA